MAPGSFKCSKCDRTFSMPAHLARHMNTIHAAKARKKPTLAKKRRGRPKGKKVARQVRAGGAGMAAIADSGHLIQQMRAHHVALVAQRFALDSQIECIGRAIEAMGFAAPLRGARKGVKRGRRTKTAARAGSLKDFIVRVLRQHGKPLSPRDIGKKVVGAGFKTKARDLTKAVSNTLPQMSGVKKVGFGLYRT